ncbi:MAG: FadR/GntR family transcriptional regulator [Pseudomonadota bacterium]
MRRRDRSVEKLTRFLAGGRYPPQSQLPPERELAQMLGLSRSALREGLEILEAEGRIWRHVGKGTFVGGRPVEGSVNLGLLSAMTSPAEVLEIRLMFEPLIAGLAALRATPAEIAHMEHLLEKSESARDAKAWELWDGTLHRAVAQAAHNRLLLAIFDAVNAMRSQTAWGKLREAALTPERLASYRRQHRGYVDAIARRDSAHAEEIMRIHIETVQDNLLGSGRAKPKEPAKPRGMGRRRTARDNAEESIEHAE